MTTPEDVLGFWFADSVLPDAPLDRHVRRWFGHDDGFDRLVRDRFEADIRRAGRGELDAWADHGRGRLALIVLLDQLPRNAFRGSPEAYAFDRRAVELCLQGLALGADEVLRPIERQFFYMPLLHSERLADQRRSVECFQRLRTVASGSQSRHFASWAQVAHRSRRIIGWFGRFPHRNAALGRVSRPAERVFLAGRAVLGRLLLSRRNRRP